MYQWLCRTILLLNEHRDMSLGEVEYCLDLMHSKRTVSSKFYTLCMQAHAQIMRLAHIVVATTVSAAYINAKIKSNDYFLPDVAILDEASQASWADTFCFLKHEVSRMVLVGDENQLDPTVISQNKVLKETVFARLSQKNPSYFVMLDTQYRMHPQIAVFPNLYFYGGLIKDGVDEVDRYSPIPYFSHHPVSFVGHAFLES
ncbi:unnamed protein product [Sphagnum balticum]